MKIYIGITQEPAKAKEYIEQHLENSGCFTEFGPFLSLLDAHNWLTYLKSLIGEFEEIDPDYRREGDDLWFGYTFEQQQ